MNRRAGARAQRLSDDWGQRCHPVTSRLEKRYGCRERTTGISTSEPQARTEGLTPSAKFVHYVLVNDGDHTQSELAEATGLSPRTIRDAVGTLVERDIATEEVCLRDARRRVYSADV